MKYILRIKCVSSCIGIRRSSLFYTVLENKTIDLKQFEHPFPGFNSLNIKDGIVTVLDKSLKLIMGEEIYFYKNDYVQSLTSKVEEMKTLGVMVMPLDSVAIDYYKDQINEGYTFDQWNGEFEYIIGLIYDYVLKDNKNSSAWYDKAKNKGFKYYLV